MRGKREVKRGVKRERLREERDSAREVGRERVIGRERVVERERVVGRKREYRESFRE
jgi:hypothetical protein